MYVYFPLRIEKNIKKVRVKRKFYSNFSQRSVLLKIKKKYFQEYREWGKIGHERSMRQLIQ